MKDKDDWNRTFDVQRQCVYKDSAHPFGMTFKCSNCEFAFELTGLREYYITVTGKREFFLHPPNDDARQSFARYGMHGYAHGFVCLSCGKAYNVFFPFIEGAKTDPRKIYPDEPLHSLEVASKCDHKCECGTSLTYSLTLRARMDKGESIPCPQCKNGNLQYPKFWIA